ncbi:MAG: hypothetical protein SO142_04710 [Prevotella sp.]|nr:hypothetical protein [Prevotella sp.]
MHLLDGVGRTLLIALDENKESCLNEIGRELSVFGYDIFITALYPVQNKLFGARCIVTNHGFLLGELVILYAEMLPT